MMSLAASSIIISEEIVTQVVENETVVINLLTEKYFHLDEIGMDIWKAIVATSSINAAIDQLSETYEVERNQIEQDVLKLVHKLEDFGLISVQPNSA